MKHYALTLLLLLPGYVLAQSQIPNLPARLDWSGYRGPGAGNPIARTIPLARSDSGKVIQPIATYGKATGAKLTSPQPVIVWRTLDSVAIQFPTSLGLPQTGGWVEVRIGGLVRFAGDLTVTPTPAVSRVPVAIQYIPLQGVQGPRGPTGPPAPTSVTDALAQSLSATQGSLSSFIAAQNTLNVQTSTDVLNRLLTSTYTTNLATQNSHDNAQDGVIATKLPASYSATQVGVDAGQNADIGSRLLSSTYTADQTTRANVTATQNSSIAANATGVVQAQQTANSALSTANSATATGATNSANIAALTSSTATIAGNVATNTTALTARTVHVADIASLTATSGSATTSVIVRDPIRGGTFSYASSGYSVDNGVVFSASGGGYWVRQYEGELQGKWWVAPDNGITDETAGIQAALNFASTRNVNTLEGSVVKLTKLSHKISRTLYIPKYVRLIGEGSYSTELIATAPFSGTAVVQLGDSLRDNNPAFGSRIEFCKINANSIVPYGVYSQKAQEESGVFDCIIFNPTQKGIWLRGDVPNVYVAEMQIRNTHVWVTGTATHGIDIQSCRVFVYNTTVLPLQNPVTSLTNIRIFGNSYATVQDSHFEGYDRAVSVEGGARAKISNVSGGNATARNAGAGGRLVYIESGQGVVTIDGAEHLDANGYVLYDNASNGMRYDVATYGPRLASYQKSDYTRQVFGNIGISGPWRTSGPELLEAPENTVVKSLNTHPFLITSPASLSNHYAVMMNTRYTDAGSAADKWNVGTYSPASGGDGTKLKFSRLSGSWSDKVLFSDAGVEIQGGTYNNPHLLIGNYHLWTTGTGIRGKSSAPTYSTDGVALLDSATAAGRYAAQSGLGSLATQSGTFSGTSSGTNTGDQDLSGLVVKANNLSDLTNASTARTNLGLGTMATQGAGGVNITGGTVSGVSGSNVTLTGAALISPTQSGTVSGAVTYKDLITFKQVNSGDNSIVIGDGQLFKTVGASFYSTANWDYFGAVTGYAGIRATKFSHQNNLTGGDIGNTGASMDLGGYTYTNTVSAGGSTLASWVNASIVGPTVAATNAITITRPVTLRISGAPVAGVNVTLTNPLAIEAIGTSTFGHVIGNSATPTTATLSAAGTGATVSIVGTDMGGTITITTGTSPNSGALASLSFATAYVTNAPAVTVSSDSATPVLVGTTSRTTAGFSVSMTSPAASTTYVINYHVIGR